jgi:DNA-binding transcriptional regulator YhcF (GntR family)
VAFRVQRRDFYEGTWLKHVQASAFYLRLFRPEKMSYERLVNPVSIPDGPVGQVAGYLDHFPFSKGVGDWLDRHNKYSTLEAEQIVANRKGGEAFSLRAALMEKDFHRRRYHQKELFYRMPARPGDAFPSVRALSKELRINPNTAAKAVTELINAGLLEMHPGVGTVVAIPPRATPEERTALLGRQIEELVVEARRLGIPEQELLRAVSAHYGRLNPKKQPTGGKDRI